MSKPYDRKYVTALGGKNISKLNENINNVIEYLSTNQYPPKFDDEDAGEVVISILDGLEKLRSVKCQDLCKIYTFLYHLIDHMKLNVVSKDDMERYQKVLNDQTKDFERSLKCLINSFEALQTRTRNRQILNCIFLFMYFKDMIYIIPLLILLPFDYRVIYIPLLFLPFKYLTQTLLKTNRIIKNEFEEYKCKKIHELKYPERKYQEPVQIITDDNLKTMNLESKINEMKENEEIINSNSNSNDNGILSTIHEEEEEITPNIPPKLNVNVQFYDDSNETSDPTEMLTKTLLEISQNKYNSDVPLLIPASLEKNLIELINILEENDPEAETLKMCKDGLEVLNKLKPK